MTTTTKQMAERLRALETKYGAWIKHQIITDTIFEAAALLDRLTGTRSEIVFTPGEVAELREAIGELAHAMGNPAVLATTGNQTIESATIREALRRVKMTKEAVQRIRDAGIDVEAPL